MLKKSFGVLQQVGKALMLPVAILPAAGLLLGLGHANVLGIPLMEQAGGIIFSNLPLLFAIGVAIGLADGDGVAALAATVGFLIMNVTIGIVAKVPTDPDIINSDPSLAQVLGIPTLQTGVFGGIIMGIVAAMLYKKFYTIELPSFLGFFAGKRFVPIVTAASAILLGLILVFIWPTVQLGLDKLADVVLNQSKGISAFIFGVIERALIPFGLHHIFYSPFWFEFGTFITEAGEVVKGDVARFFAGDPTAGTFMTGKFPFMMFGLPAAALAMYQEARPEKKKLVAGILASAALTSFLTGITEPIEFTFLFIAPLLYGIHCIFAGISFMLMDILGVKAGMTFSGGFIDYLLYWNLSTKSWLIIPIGLCFAVVYYFGFRFFIRKFDIKTPGREKEEELLDTDKKVEKSDLPVQIIKALGGEKNIDKLDACITRLRITVNDIENVDKGVLKKLGAAGVLEVGNNIQAIFGPKSDIIKTQMKKIMERKIPKGEEVEIDKMDIEETAEKIDKKVMNSIEIVSPIDGELLELEDVPDKVFSEKMMGDGFAILPENGEVVSPIDGTVAMVFGTKHAIGLKAENGLELLVHFGIDTVKLEGKGFETYVKQGETIMKGDPLMSVDLHEIKNTVPSIVTPIVITNLPKDKEVLVHQGKNVKRGEGNILTIRDKG
ncbi:glucose-specific PTS transporter subunit IIBC [Oceanirhabdus seepicola]|uniref:PTS transporter subunit EIIC n=1 Tax=Oceanirhabdus seepicola TaxID=2828781 RepID=A0A9J6NX02_9CLOT|nr:glucose-specific PTS transporter subunit IIBC [Oceanirhabdus seepicola]MCM1988526.1 PTS transporter subunit EIIC [Oceanirhabdus seepicola]